VRLRFPIFTFRTAPLRLVAVARLAGLAEAEGRLRPALADD